MNPRIKDITGQRFNELTAISFAGYYTLPDGKKRTVWNFKCSCGVNKKIDTSSVISGNTKSCGCYKIREGTARLTTHGCATGGGIPEYWVWSAMKARITNPRNKQFKDYGGRGIEICPSWMSSFASFIHDMGRRPSSKHTLDRIDNNGNYTPENCAWRMRLEQQRNMRSNRILTLGDESLCAAEWAERFGIRYGTLLGRLQRGWTVEDALTIEVKAPKSHRRKKKKKRLPFLDVTTADKLYRSLGGRGFTK